MIEAWQLLGSSCPALWATRSVNILATRLDRIAYLPVAFATPGMPVSDREAAAMRKSIALAFVALFAGPLTAADLQVVRAARTDYTGAELYAQHCARCHAQGVAGAPRPGLAEEWKPRLAAGRATLLLSVIKGQGGMPPKGGNASLTAAEAEAALAYMLSVPAPR